MTEASISFKHCGVRPGCGGWAGEASAAGWLRPGWLAANMALAEGQKSGEKK